MRTSTARLPAVAAAAALVAVLAAGCGGGSGASSPGGGGAGGELAVIRSQPLHGSTPKAPRLAGADAKGAVTSGRKISRARFPGGRDAEEGPDVYQPVKPCSLVTRAEAAAITGRAMGRVFEAPQGPTCVFQARGARSSIALSVQNSSFAAMKRHMRILGRRSVGAGRQAYCVRFGTAGTYVPLAGGRVLYVGAPCAVGTRFAARALTRLHG